LKILAHEILVLLATSKIKLVGKLILWKKFRLIVCSKKKVKHSNALAKIKKRNFISIYLVKYITMDY
jgi:hypothetical protein